MNEEEARRRNADDLYRKERQKKLEAKFLSENGPRYKREAGALGIQDNSQQQEIAQEAARLYAEHSTKPGQVFFHDDRGLVERVISKREAAQAETDRKEKEATELQLKSAATDYGKAGDAAQPVDRLQRQNDHNDVLSHGAKAAPLVADFHAAAHEVCDPRSLGLPPSNGAGNTPPSNPPRNDPPNDGPPRGLNQLNKVTAPYRTYQDERRELDPKSQAFFERGGQRIEQLNGATPPVGSYKPLDKASIELQQRAESDKRQSVDPAAKAARQKEPGQSPAPGETTPSDGLKEAKERAKEIRERHAINKANGRGGGRTR